MAKTRRIKYTDEKGRNWLVLLPAHAPDSHRDMGQPLTPDLSDLPLADELTVELHQYLWDMGLQTYDDYRNPEAVTLIRRALQRLYKLKAHSIKEYVLHLGEDYEYISPDSE